MHQEVPEKLKITAFSVFVILLLLIGFLFFRGNSEQNSSKLVTSTTSSYPIQEFIIDLSGAVNSPGVYKISSDTIVLDLIKKAGGFSDDADKGYIEKNINLSRTLKNCEKVYIPRLSDASVAGVSTNAMGLININSASDAELDSLVGVGAATISKWKAARPFNSLQELVTKSVISQTTFDKIKDKLTL